MGIEGPRPSPLLAVGLFVGAGVSQALCLGLSRRWLRLAPADDNAACRGRWFACDWLRPGAGQDVGGPACRAAGDNKAALREGRGTGARQGFLRGLVPF